MAAHNWLSFSLLAPMFHIRPSYMYMYVTHCYYGNRVGNHYGNHVENPIASHFVSNPVSSHFLYAFRRERGGGHKSGDMYQCPK